MNEIDQFLKPKIYPTDIIKLIHYISKTDPDAFSKKTFDYLTNNYQNLDESSLLPFAISIRCGGKITINEFKSINHPVINTIYLLIYFMMDEYSDNIHTLFNVNSTDELVSSLYPKYYHKILVMLDKVNNTVRASLSEVIRDHSVNYTKHLIEGGEIDNNEFFGLCVKYLNYSGFEMYIHDGHLPSYYIVNNILMTYNYYNKNKLEFETNYLKQMIRLLLRQKYRLDPYQTTYLSESIESFIGIEHGNTYINPELKLYADLLFIDTSKGKLHILSELRNISNIKRMKKAAIKMSILRIANMLTGPDKYMKTDFELNYCIDDRFQNLDSNKNEIDLFYMTDSNQIQWIFTSEIFEKICKTKKNIYTDDLIDDQLIKLLNTRRSLLKRLGLKTYYDLSTSHPHSPSTQLLVDYKHPQLARNKFFYLAKIYGILSYQIESFEIKTLQKILNVLNQKNPNHYPKINIIGLHKDHAHFTFYRYICDHLKNDINLIPSLFKIIKKYV